MTQYIKKCSFVGCVEDGSTWFYPEGSSMFVCKYWVCEAHKNG